MPKGRLKTEFECLNLWREAGFRVFGTYDDVRVEGQPEGGYTLFEYVDRPKFVHYFADKSIPLDERLETWRRFLPVWHHENGDLKHVMLMEDGQFLFFDFEMVFRSKRRVREFVGREILSYLKSLGKTVGRKEWDVFLAETVEHYPDRSLLEYTWNFAYRNHNPVLRAARWIDRKFRSRAKKPFSKYSVALKLRTLLEQG